MNSFRADLSPCRSARTLARPPLTSEDGDGFYDRRSTLYFGAARNFFVQQSAPNTSRELNSIGITSPFCGHSTDSTPQPMSPPSNMTAPRASTASCTSFQAMPSTGFSPTLGLMNTSSNESCAPDSGCSSNNSNSRTTMNNICSPLRRAAAAALCSSSSSSGVSSARSPLSARSAHMRVRSHRMTAVIDDMPFNGVSCRNGTPVIGSPRRYAAVSPLTEMFPENSGLDSGYEYIHGAPVLAHVKLSASDHVSQLKDLMSPRPSFSAIRSS